MENRSKNFLLKFCLYSYASLSSLLAHGEDAPASPTAIDLQAEPQAIQKYVQTVKKPGAAYIVMPAGWSVIDPQELPSTVKMLAAKKGKREIPLTLNLASEPTNRDLAGYLKIVKEINESEDHCWKQLGYISTPAGAAHLSRKQIASKWGDVVLVHAILVKEQTAYIVTASGLKEEFQENYDAMMSAIRSLTINPSIFEMIEDPSKREKLHHACQAIENQWREMYAHQENTVKIFQHKDFQERHWKPFQEALVKDFKEMDENWHQSVLDTLKERMEQFF